MDKFSSFKVKRPSYSCRLVQAIADISYGHYGNRIEELLRNKLASFCRLIDLRDWSHDTNYHITARIGDSNAMLMNPLGLLHHEVTASCFMKISLDGNVVDAGKTNLGHDHAASSLNSGIYKQRPDLRCIVYFQNSAVNAVACMKCGLMPLVPSAMELGQISYYTFKGAATDRKLVTELGENRVILIPHSGFVVCGSSIEQTFHLTSLLINAAEIQESAMAAGLNNIVVPSVQVQKEYNQTMCTSPTRSQRTAVGGRKHAPDLVQREWEAWMRFLDDSGLQSGTVYSQEPFASEQSIARPILPIADVTDVSKYSLQEETLRNKVASLCRLLASDVHGLKNMITQRVAQNSDDLIVTPLGQLFSQMSASSLLKVDFNGNVLDNAMLGLNQNAFKTHAAIHRFRPEINCVFSLNTNAVAAVSCMQWGLLPTCSEALNISATLSYHQPSSFDEHENKTIIKDLGTENKIMIVRNQGFIICTSSIEEGFHLTKTLISACKTQVESVSLGVDNINFMRHSTSSVTNVLAEWEAEMRQLDRDGYRSGHIYSQPQPIRSVRRSTRQSDI